jgi:hypothetical protein
LQFAIYVKKWISRLFSGLQKGQGRQRLYVFNDRRCVMSEERGARSEEKQVA